MKEFTVVTYISTLLCLPLFGQAVPADRNAGLEQEISVFTLTDGTLVEGLSELSRNPDARLHLGIEEALRERITDPVDRSVHFSLRLERSTVQEILNALCRSDSRYRWSTDGPTINVYPSGRESDQSNLLNFRISRIALNGIPDADEALTPLSELFPGEPIGYFHMGPAYPYSTPWTVIFENVTVREFINRINEHLGPRSSWIWQGGKDSRMFNFIRGGFR